MLTSCGADQRDAGGSGTILGREVPQDDIDGGDENHVDADSVQDTEGEEHWVDGRHEGRQHHRREAHEDADRRDDTGSEAGDERVGDETAQGVKPDGDRTNPA